MSATSDRVVDHDFTAAHVPSTPEEWQSVAEAIRTFEQKDALIQRDVDCDALSLRVPDDYGKLNTQLMLI